MNVWDIYWFIMCVCEWVSAFMLHNYATVHYQNYCKLPVKLDSVLLQLANWLIELELNCFSSEIKVVWSARVNFLEIKLFDASKFWHLHDPIKVWIARQPTGSVWFIDVSLVVSFKTPKSKRRFSSRCIIHESANDFSLFHNNVEMWFILRLSLSLSLSLMLRAWNHKTKWFQIDKIYARKWGWCP